MYNTRYYSNSTSMHAKMIVQLCAASDDHGDKGTAAAAAADDDDDDDDDDYHDDHNDHNDDNPNMFMLL